MKNELINTLNEFANNLSKLSARPIDELEIILPYENYKRIEYELSSSIGSPIKYGKPGSKYKLKTLSGLTFHISCKELNDVLTQEKLQECFKILSK